MNCSTPGLPVNHQLLEFNQTHVHWVGNAIQPSHPVVPFSSCPQSLPASESFPVSQLFAWGGQSTGVSSLASFLAKNTQDWSPLEWTGWISLQSKGLSRVFSNTTVKWSEVSQSCPTLCDPIDCCLPGSSIHGIFQARVLEWVAISFSTGSSWPKDWTLVSYIPGRHFNLWATREAHIYLCHISLIKKLRIQDVS